jgi:rSAM/selenodomain-associated transferase 1
VSIAVGVMARAPSSGGKSRLAPHLPPARLAALREALLADTLLVAERLPDVTIFFTPDDAEEEMSTFTIPALRRVPQGDGDLGTRMFHALQFLLNVTPGAPDAAILVGSDIPLLTADHISEASETLHASGGLVLGPADDGGYYLIGMTEARAALFDGIAWGTETVLTDTLRIAERLGVDARLARSAYDVDTIDDLRRVERDLAAAPSTLCPALRRWFSEA